MSGGALQFGPFEVNLEIHELRKHGLRVRLAEQPFHALVVLLERQGQVVSRGELQKVLWPDEQWGDLDHRLNKTVNRLRGALGDSAESPRFVETIPRIGYRFLVPVEPLRLRAAEPLKPVQTTAAPPVRRMPVVAWLAGVAAFGLLAALALFRGDSKPVRHALESTPVTTYVGSELYPSFSPDGAEVVFAWDGESQGPFHLFVTSVSDSGPRQLTFGQQSESGPVWSPDGRHIAFLRNSSDARAEVLLIDPDGKNERKVAEIVPAMTDHPLSWYKDSRSLVVAADPPGDGPAALFLLSIGTGEARRLTSPPLRSGGDLSPAVSPDGTKLAFTRSTSNAWRDIFVVPLSGDLTPAHEPLRVTDLHRLVDTIAWTADCRGLYFSAAETLAGARSIYRVDASAARLNEGLAETGIEGTDPAVSLTGSALLYVRENIEQTSVWRVEPGSPPRRSRLMSSTRRDYTADLSPDGKRLAFSSARSGPTEIWTSRTDGSELKRVASLGASPRWSPDGRRIAFESTVDGQSEIYVIDVDSGNRLRLTDQPGADIYPSWSRDGGFIYWSSDRSGKPQIWKIASRGGDPVQITRQGGVYAVEAPDGRSIYYTTPEQPATIRRAPANGGAELDIMQGVVGRSSIAMTPRGLYYLSAITSNSARLDFYSFDGRGDPTFLAIDRPVHRVLSSPPDGSAVLFTQIDRQDHDLMLVKLK